MKETGIIMSGNHPTLILDGRKTQTRRTNGLKEINQNPDDWLTSNHYVDKDWIFLLKSTGEPKWVKCPYGQVGDRLWVREAHAYICNPDPESDDGVVLYKASADEVQLGIYKWRPSIHMHKWASRITKETALLRVERLRDISAADAQAEGGYTVAEFIQLFLKINHLPNDANPWNWVIGW